MTILAKLISRLRGTDPDAAERQADHARAIEREAMTDYERFRQERLAAGPLDTTNVDRAERVVYTAYQRARILRGGK